MVNYPGVLTSCSAQDVVPVRHCLFAHAYYIVSILYSVNGVSSVTRLTIQPTKRSLYHFYIDISVLSLPTLPPINWIFHCSLSYIHAQINIAKFGVFCRM